MAHDASAVNGQVEDAAADPLPGPGAVPGAPAAAVVSSEDIVRWTGQVEGEFLGVKETLSAVSAKVDALSASLAGMTDSVAACSSQSSHLELALQQFVENHAARGGGSLLGDTARERLLQKSQLSDDSAAWKKPGSRKHWFIRGRLPPNIGESPADLQAFVGEDIHVTAKVAAQLRSLSDFDVALFGPRGLCTDNTTGSRQDSENKAGRGIGPGE